MTARHYLITMLIIYFDEFPALLAIKLRLKSAWGQYYYRAWLHKYFVWCDEQQYIVKKPNEFHISSWASGHAYFQTLHEQYQIGG